MPQQSWCGCCSDLQISAREIEAQQSFSMKLSQNPN
jgi:hypothetical protein